MRKILAGAMKRPNVSKRAAKASTGVKALIACAAIVAGAVALEAQRFGRGATLYGGKALLFIGTYGGNIQMFDEATEKLAGEIKLETGIPRSLILSFDKKRFYVLDSTLEKVEVVDIASRKTVDTFTLSTGATRTRIRSMQVDPLQRFMILLTRSATKKSDGWQISDVALQLYDLQQK